MMCNNKSTTTVWYICMPLSAFVLDRITKWLALEYASDGYYVNDFLAYEVVFNRGVSFGLLDSHQSGLFTLVTFATILISALLLVYACYRYMTHASIAAELLVIAGAISNIIDRFAYHGVIDFIVLHYNDYVFPVFNLADVYIVLGVFIMFFTHMKE